MHPTPYAETHLHTHDSKRKPGKGGEEGSDRSAGGYGRRGWACKALGRKAVWKKASLRGRPKGLSGAGGWVPPAGIKLKAELGPLLAKTPGPSRAGFRVHPGSWAARWSGRRR